MTKPRLVFVGSKQAGFDVLRSISGAVSGVVTLDDRGDLRTAFADMTAFAQEKGLPLKIVTAPEAEAAILMLKPDLLVVCGWYWILGPRLLEGIPKGAVGIHHSLLPNYRGGAPLVWAMINGERKVGTTLFYLSRGMDDGDIVAQRSTTVREADYVGNVLGRLHRLDVEMISENIGALLKGQGRRKVQNHARATYCGQRTPDEGRIDWSWSAERVRNFIRAQSDPYPGAWTEMGSERVTIWRAGVFDRPYYGHPGQVLQIVEPGVLVGCAPGTAVLVEEVQKGTHRGRAGEVLRSNKIRLG